MPTPIGNPQSVTGYPIVVNGSKGFDSPYIPAINKGWWPKFEDEDCRKKLPKVIPEHQAICKSSACCGWPWGYGIPCYCACITQFGFCEAAKPYFSPTRTDDPGYTGPPPVSNLVSSGGNSPDIVSTSGPPNTTIIVIGSQNNNTIPLPTTTLIDGGNNQQPPSPKPKTSQFDASRFMSEYNKRY